MKFISVFFLLSMVICFSLSAASEDEVSAVEMNFQEEEGGITCVKSDRDRDGMIDYLLRIDSLGSKLYEELDFNYDGEMDDFYYYSSGVLRRREIDTNYDLEVDLWVYIFEGVYIERYERDTDFDGTIDLIKDFSAIETEAETESEIESM